MEEKKLQCLLFLIQKYSPYTVVGCFQNTTTYKWGAEKKSVVSTILFQ